MEKKKDILNITDDEFEDYWKENLKKRISRAMTVFWNH